LTGQTKGENDSRFKVQRERDDEQVIIKIKYEIEGGGISWKNHLYGGKYIALKKLDNVREMYKEKVIEM
jgi:hypothetical protein